MYSLFGTKWPKLHAGPMWSVAPINQGEVATLCITNPREVCARFDSLFVRTRTVACNIFLPGKSEFPSYF